MAYTFLIADKSTSYRNLFAINIRLMYGRDTAIIEASDYKKGLDILKSKPSLDNCGGIDIIISEFLGLFDAAKEISPCTKVIVVSDSLADESASFKALATSGKIPIYDKGQLFGSQGKIREVLLKHPPAKDLVSVL
jgi:hypothetical protein